MKVVISSWTFPPEIGGVGTNVSVLAKAFAAAGHAVTVVTLMPGPLEGYGHAVVRNPGPLQLFRLYRGADILILSNLALKLLYPLLVLRRRFALRHHSESVFQLSSSPFSADLLRRAVLPRATHFMTSGYVGRKSGFRDYVVTHPFANPADITADVILPMAARSDAVFVGRLEPEKGILYLLERWEHARQILGVEKLRIIGDGSLHADIQRRVTAGEFRHVEFVGPLPRAEAARAMGQAVFSFVPSLWEEPFGAVALESLAAGAITLHSGRGGLGEAAGTLGFAFNPDEEASLGRALAAAAALHSRLRDSAEAEAAYRADVAAHLAGFAPQNVVQKIIAAMTGPAA